MSTAGPSSSTGSHRLHPPRRPGPVLSVRMDLAEYVPMTDEQRDRALNALAALGDQGATRPAGPAFWLEDQIRVVIAEVTSTSGAPYLG
jgi:hypothetical protein